jgi:hypothetical protein
MSKATKMASLAFGECRLGRHPLNFTGWRGQAGGDLPRSGRRAGCLEPVFDRILAELALDMAAKLLKGGGDALIKVFQGSGFQELVQEACRRFAKAKLVKPTAFRARSSEMYLLAKDFRLV